jgi:hypothetical protein
VTGHRHRAPTSAPLSTKLIVGLGAGLVVFGFALAGWERLSDDPDAAAPPPAVQSAARYLPSLDSLMLFVGGSLVALIAGVYVMVRARGQTRR